MEEHAYRLAKTTCKNYLDALSSSIFWLLAINQPSHVRFSQVRSFLERCSLRRFNYNIKPFLSFLKKQLGLMANRFNRNVAAVGSTCFLGALCLLLLK